MKGTAKEIAQYKKYLKLSLPEFEETHKIDPTDKPTMQKLSAVYYQLGMYDKQKEIKAKMEK